MHRLLLLLAGLLLATIGLGMVAVETPAPWQWRDALLVSGAGLLLFVLNGRRLTTSAAQNQTLQPDQPSSAAANEGRYWEVDVGVKSSARSLFTLQFSSVTLVFWVILLLAILLRFWRLASWPPACIAEECQRALRLGEGQNVAGALGWVAQALLSWQQEPLLALRLAGAVIGSLMLPFFYLLLHRLVTPPAALLGLLLLAINPWHLYASRSGEPWLAPLLACILLLYLTFQCFQPRYTLPKSDAEEMSGGQGDFAAPRSLPSWWSALFVLGGVALLLGTLIVLPLPATFSLGWPTLPTGLLSAIPAGELSPFAGAPTLAPWTTALALLGLAVVLHAGLGGWRREWRGVHWLLALSLLVLISFLAVVTIWLGAVVSEAWSATSVWLLWLPLFLLLATVALDRLWSTLWVVWRRLLRPRQLLATTLAFLLLLGGGSTWALVQRLDSLRAATSLASNVAIARYLVEQAQQQPDAHFFVPASLRNDPAARLLVSDLFAGGRAVAFDPGALPFQAQVAGDLVYLFPATEAGLRDLLLQIYPGSTTGDISPEAEAASDPIPVAWVRVPSAALPGQPLPAIGLTGVYFGAENTQGEILMQRHDPLPGYPVDLPLPYSVVWRGQLAAVRTGEYLIGAVAEGGVTLSVDGIVLVDRPPDETAEQVAGADAQNGQNAAESPNVHEGMIYLQQGWHFVEIRYTPHNAATPVAFYWQIPGSVPVPIQPAFFSPLVDGGEIPALPVALAPVIANPRLGSPEGFALTTSIDLWQAAKQTAALPLPRLPLDPVWQNASGCGAEPNQLNQPHGVLIDPIGGRIYVADTGNRRLSVYSLRGEFQTAWSSDQFQEPVDLAFDRSGKLLILDAAAMTILRSDPSSGQMERLSTSVSFYFPRGLATDDTGNIFVADTGGARIVVLDANGQMLAEFGGAGSALQRGQPVDVLPQAGAWWAVTAEDGRLWQLEMLGSVGALQATNTIHGPHLTALPDGRFFASDPINRSVVAFAANGQPLQQLESASGWDAPTGVAVALIEGSVYLAVVDTGRCSVGLWRVSS